MDNYGKLWIQQSLNPVSTVRAREEIDQDGQGLTCHVIAVSGALVTVAFDVISPWTIPQITIPKDEGPYFRNPTQVGDIGLAVPSGIYIGGLSGLGGGIADMVRRGNLSSLRFRTISSKGSPPPNQTQAIAQGPGGFLGQTLDGTSSVNVTGSGTVVTIGSTTVTVTSSEIVLTAGGNSVTVNSSGVAISGTLTINGAAFLAHAHSGVTTGSGDTGGVT